jgi:hypothetical protein
MRARDAWTPEVGRWYGIRPWEMGRLRPAELQAIRRHHEQMKKAAEADG